ncbi:hypothetical protein SAMN04487996_103270 [Dyadobacter soli]|uniref:Uncharacterized protein n=1 Tax=Dyadobacter soli TaxID=659014 RepID=A0A1G6ZXB5_9BACT|nr:hypothetical protein SAMN04487996_103270 [Dyadobacter soli]
MDVSFTGMGQNTICMLTRKITAELPFPDIRGWIGLCARLFVDSSALKKFELSIIRFKYTF